MSDLRSLIGFLKSEIREETEYQEEKMQRYADGHKGAYYRDYYTQAGIIEGMKKVQEMVETWCDNHGIDYGDIIEDEEEEDY